MPLSGLWLPLARPHCGGPACCPGHKQGLTGRRVGVRCGVGVLRASVRRVACARALRVGALCPVAMPAVPAVAWRTGPAAPNQPDPAPHGSVSPRRVYRSIDVPAERRAFPAEPFHPGPRGAAVVGQ